MKTRRTAKGFTLVELIVVIAIIGVLAAILVPSMLGYVKKSKVSAANSNAKSLFNAAATAIVELDTEGNPLKSAEGGTNYNCKDAGDKTGLVTKVETYFEGVKSLKQAYVRVVDTSLVSAAVYDGAYWGANPHGTTVDNATQAEGSQDAVLAYAADSNATLGE